MAEVIVLCSWAKHFTLTVPLSSSPGQGVYEWALANLMLEVTLCLNGINQSIKQAMIKRKIANKSLDLSMKVYNTLVLIRDTEISTDQLAV